MSDAHHTTDWAAWSREAVETMMARNAQWPRQFGLLETPHCQWNLDRATLVFDAPLHQVIAHVCLVGTSSEQDGSFVWSWANEAIPAHHGRALEAVHDFGRENQLALLTTPVFKADALWRWNAWPLRQGCKGPWVRMLSSAVM